ncbi:MAG: peptide chain release factor N(5)-glutamine methyltransferase [Pseudonocardiales bacterium]|nr:peptide chain release factor N(5)-glutamine methyltransferase [Pseudonocardiales bacterium]MBV9028754.1 peptide chain release factor N(5)-glutamine methyltransferase [Pseudonocardiales bacterium]
MSRQPLRLAVLEAQRVLTDAGVACPRVDAELLAAHVLGVPRGRLPMVPLVDPSVVEALRMLVSRRAERVPLQHLTGTAAMGAIDVAVGPGVFIPRPETEVLLAWGLAAVRGVARPLVVDLCTGSGALALALAHARPDAQVHAVERDAVALSWARRNADTRAEAGDTPVALYAGDIADPGLLGALDGMAHLVLCNPPYVPVGVPVAPEVALHDPPAAVFAGHDGLAVIPDVVRTGTRLLREGGSIAIEHDDSHAVAVPALLAARRVLTDVADHVDLAGRPRFATAQRTTLPVSPESSPRLGR